MANICRQLALILVIAFSLLANTLTAASWQAYTYTDQYRRACRIGGQLYVLKGKTLYLADTGSWQLLRELNRTDGLSSSAIFDVACCERYQRLAVVHESGIVDVIHPDGAIRTIPDFANAPQPATDKTIRHVRLQDDQLFVSTGSGFFVVDMHHDLIRHSFQLGTPVHCAWAYNGRWYYSSDKGTFACPQSANAFRPGAWELISTYRITDAIVFRRDAADLCFLLTSDHNVRRITPTEAASTRCTSSGNISRIFRSGDFVFTLRTDSLVVYDTRLGPCPAVYETPVEGQRFTCPVNGSLRQLADVCPLSDQGSTLALVDPTQGIEADSLCLQPSGTFSLLACHDQPLVISNHQQSPSINTIAIGAGAEVGMTFAPLLKTKYGDIMKTGGFLTTYDIPTGQWHNYDASDVADARTDRQRFVGVDFMTADPNHPSRYWYGTLEDGIIVVDHGALYEQIDYKNSSLLNCSSGCTRIAGITIGPNDDLWCVDENVADILWCRLASTGKWHKFNIPGLDKNYGFSHLILTRHGGRHQLWGYQQMLYTISSVFVYDYGRTVASTADDQVTSFKTIIPIADQADGATPGEAALPPFTPHYGRGLHEGPDGAIWLFNTSGLYVIDQPDSVFAHPGEARAVMTDVIPTAMATDANGHLWVATEGHGIYLLSSDGRRQLTHFTTSNSLLPTDEILTLAYEPRQSCLWIATEGQLLTYQYDPNDFGQPDDFVPSAYCYPSDVRRGEYASVSLFGASESSTVTLTNSQGRILAEDTALGQMCSFDVTSLPVGTYTLSGTDIEGHRGTLATFTVSEPDAPGR